MSRRGMMRIMTSSLPPTGLPGSGLLRARAMVRARAVIPALPVVSVVVVPGIVSVVAVGRLLGIPVVQDGAQHARPIFRKTLVGCGSGIPRGLAGADHQDHLIGHAPQD